MIVKCGLQETELLIVLKLYKLLTGVHPLDLLFLQITIKMPTSRFNFIGTMNAR